MELFMKSYIECIISIVRYSDYSEMQVCFNKWNKSCEIYRALPGVKRGINFMRNSKFQFDFEHLLALSDVFSQVSNYELKYVIAVERDKRLVLSKNKEFGNWNLGYEMKRKVSDVQLLLADLDKIKDEDIEVLTSLMSPAVFGFEIDQFECFPFRKKDLFAVVAELVEFRRIVLDLHPELRRGN